MDYRAALPLEWAMAAFSSSVNTGDEGGNRGAPDRGAVALSMHEQR